MAQEEGEAAPVTRGDFQKLLSALATVEEKVSGLKRELSDEQEAANQRLAKKLKLDKKPTFRKKAHEKQFLFNEEVGGKLEEAKAALGQTPPAVEKAKTVLAEGEKLIVERQKLIRIADRSEHGWATVEEYIDDELADNSDDEKRLYKAELRAGRKRKVAEAAKGKQRKGVSARPGPSRYPGKTVGNAAQLPLQTFPMAVQPGQRMPFVMGPGTTSTLGPCFQCGKMGHFRKACPLLQNLPVGSK